MTRGEKGSTKKGWLDAVGGPEGEGGGCTVACTCALPPYTTRSYGVFLDAVAARMCARSYLNRRNQLHFWMAGSKLRL